jgi:hypothetical protein
VVKAEEGDLLPSSGNAMGRGKISTQLIFIHLQVTNISYRFIYTKELGARGKRYA